MATQDILKQAVYDARIVQPEQMRYAVEKGGLSVSNAPFRAVSASTSQLSFQINVPSQNVFVDRAFDWTSDVLLDFTATYDAFPQPGGFVSQNVVSFGQNIALAAFPLHELTATLRATINDTSVSIDIDSVLHEVLRLTDYKRNRLIRTCPTMLDRYAFYSDAQDAVNSPLGSYFEATSNDEVPNGAYFDIVFTDPNGLALNASVVNPVFAGPGQPVGSYTFQGTGGNTYVMLTNAFGIPQTTDTTSAGVVVDNLIYPLHIRFRSTEKIVLSPFIFADSYEYSCGFFGLNNIQLVFNLKSSPQRVLRFERPTSLPFLITDVKYNTAANGGAIQNAQVNVQFITPSLDLPLPSKNSVEYYEFPRFVTTGEAPLLSNELKRDIQSQTIVNYCDCVA